MFETFQIQILPQIIFLSVLVKNKSKPHIFKSIFFLNQFNLMFSKNCGFRSWKGWNIQTLFYWKPTPLKLFLGYATNGHVVSLRQNKNKGLSLLTVGQYAQDRVGERRKFSPLIFQWQEKLILKIKKKYLKLLKAIKISSINQV